ncbi:hypothetical protein [Aeromicrobium sp. UC242_57]|uniref:hypothetical protein n=1 Tax=Aeromicrobium sp. UC242_57 TaxID=3374624 RepID=UPI0037A246CF
MLLFGSNMLDEDPKVGQALIRAAARTVRDHLKPGYKEDPETVEAMAAAFKTSEDAISSGSELVWDPDLAIGYELEGVPAGTPDYLSLIQETFLAVGGVIEYTQPLTRTQVYDQSFLDAVIKK